MRHRKGKVGALGGLILLAGVYPLYRLWQSAHGWAVRHALVWGWLAWVAWCLAGWLDEPRTHYLALSLTACAGVAVLGARRPMVTAWHLVVAGLLLLLLRPLWEGQGDFQLDSTHATILGAALTVALGNYLPTRQGATAVLLGAWCALDMARLTGAAVGGWPLAWAVPAAVPWLGLLLGRRRTAATEFDALWLGFRDRFGFLWAQRLRDQFNRASVNAGWRVSLGWGGLRQGSPGLDEAKALAVLRSALRRFETTTALPPSGDGVDGG
jgi:hypothetical protein